jgi:3-oxoacyl-[acyl-carrier protein] reductase
MTGMTVPLSGRVAVVTAAGSDPGRAIAMALADAGARVWCVDADQAGAETTAQEITQTGGQASAYAADAGVRADIEAGVTEIAGQAGRIDVLCNVAGRPGDGALIEDLDVTDFDTLFRANFKGTMFACQAAGKVMAKAGRGSIINVTSAIIDVPAARTGNYAVAAAAIGFLTKVLAREVGEHDVRVNAIAGGPDQGLDPFRPADSGLTAAAYHGLPQPGQVLKRAGTPADLGGLAVFLAADASAHITGQTIRVSGGWTMPW